MLSAIIFLPLLGAIAIALLPRDSERGVRWTAAIFSGASLLLSLIAFAQFDRSATGVQFVERVPWIPTIGVQYFLGVDGLNLPMVLLTTLLTFLAILGSWKPINHRLKEYYALLLLLEVGVVGVFSSLDLLLFFLFWEVELIPMYLLIAIWGPSPERREYAALKFVLYTVFGSALMLVGILALYFQSSPHTFDMLVLSATPFTAAFQLVAFVFLFIGFAIKLPVFPLHTWLPWAHVEAPTAVSVLLAGVLLKMGGYGMFRVAYTILPEAAKQYAWIIAVLAVVNILYGAVVSLIQDDLKKMVAFSSVSHMGYVLLGLAAATTISLNGAALQMFTHGTITGLMFLLVGGVYEKTHTRSIARMGGLAPRMPWLAIFWVLAGLASLGLPSMSGFIAEFLVFIGSFQNPAMTVFTILGASGIVITAGYILWMLQRVFFGPSKPEWGHIGDAAGVELVPLFVLMAVVFLVGVYPAVLTDIIGTGVAPLAAKMGTTLAVALH
ncbi:MAG: NADH-quinone oxidoreductase subunit M [Bacteroidetes bacterium]|nr:NADH-quinone oxidoreductase subunit M [Bacteroidota bacterium]